MAGRNIKLLIAYDGTAYAGWQRQKADPTIQGILEEKLALMTGHSVTLHGAGRTDAGVHALGMAANFHTVATIPLDGFRRGLNSMLPEDIRILAAGAAAAEFHARYSAKGKVYLYNLNFSETVLPTERLYVAQFAGPCDIERMKTAAAALIGEHDFSSFEATGSRDPDNDSGRGAVRLLTGAAFIRDPQNAGRCQFLIAGDGFLRHMVRNIVGTLVEVGQGRRAPQEFAQLIAARDRTLAGPTAPAKGLILKEVMY